MDYVSANQIASKLADVEKFFSRDVGAFTRRLTELDSAIAAQAEPQRDDFYHRLVLEAFEESQEACARFETKHGDDPLLIKDVQAGFRKETEHWFHRSWIAHRARSKPSGFAGDFEMLIKLYEEATPAHGIGGYLDLCILELPLARAVRARMKALREFLLNEVQGRTDTVRVLDIASGPCREFFNWPESRVGGRMEVVAMDNDPKALEYVEKTVVPRLPASVEFHATRYNALRTRSADTTIRKFGKFDIIYSVGLWDYLPDDQLIAILGALKDTLVDGGVLYIAFKDTERYDKTPYQWHLDWFFFQRTENDCLRLYENAGFRMDGIRQTRDETGIIINFITRRPGAGIVRTHMPENILTRLGGHVPLTSNVAPNE